MVDFGAYAVLLTRLFFEILGDTETSRFSRHANTSTAMRILHISSAKTFGGGERHVADLCRGLQESDFEIFAAIRPTNQWQDKLDFLKPENILYVSIRHSFGVLSSMRIAEFMKQNKIDIVHAHVARDYIPTNIACLAARPARFVLTRHVLFPLKPFNRFALNSLSAAIAVSDAVADSLKTVFPQSKIHVIKNGMDVSSVPADVKMAEYRDEFRAGHSIAEDEFLLGTLGELKELKGQRDLVIAAAEVLKRIPNARFVIVGEDNSPGRTFRRDLRRLAKVLGIAERIIWLDWLNDTRPFYSAIELFVSPSHSESFGLAMLEAMAYGKPVAATATDGARELLGPKADLVPIGDPVSLANAIVRFAESKQRRIEAGNVNRAIVCDRFSLQRMVQETAALYRQVLGQ